VWLWPDAPVYQLYDGVHPIPNAESLELMQPTDLAPEVVVALRYIAGAFLIASIVLFVDTFVDND